MLGTLLFRQSMVWSLLTDPSNGEYLWNLLVPLGFLSLAGAEVLLVGLPHLGMTFITHTTWFTAQYPSGLIACIWFAAAAA